MVITMKRQAFRTDRREKTIVIVAFLAIPLLLMAVFSFLPAGKLVQLSFTDWTGLGDFDYVGFRNYQELFRNGELLQVLANVSAYIVVMLVQVFLALFLAVILNQSIKGKNFFRSVTFLPYMLNGVAVAFMFNIMFDFERGPFNVLLNALGLGQYAVHRISASYMTNYSLGLIALWRYTGFNMVIFLGGLQSVSNEYYEAANIDGASFIQKVRYITLPSIRTTFEINLLLGFNGALQAYYEPFVITKGGPGGMTDTFVAKSLKYAFEFQNFGLASALAVLLMLMIIGAMLLSKLVMSKKEA